VFISIVVPVYNDYASAEELCIDFLRARLSNTELLLVDNGSENPDELNSLIELNPGLIKLLRLNSNIGFGGGVQAGMRHSTSEWVVWMPGNVKVKPSTLHEFLDTVFDSRTEVIVKAVRSGRRFIPNLKTLIASLVQTLASLSLMFDTGGTPTAVNRQNRIFNLVLSGPNDYTFESYVLFLANKLGAPVRRVAVPYGERLWGKSHWQSGIRSEVTLMLRILKGLPNWLKIAKAFSKV